MKVLVTGGAGFIGSALIRHLLAETDATVVNVDRLTYAGSRHTIAAWRDEPRHHFVQQDICDAQAMTELFPRHRPSAVVHLAAESHVDRSIERPAEFIRTNVTGTYTLLESTLGFWEALSPSEREAFRFVHVSTDEVYGSLTPADPAFTETTPYAPSSPYAASKAAADHLARAWWRTYGLPVIVSNCSNNYGPYQFPEKLIPLAILKAVAGEPIPVYGSGQHVRDWLFVEDHAVALHTILRRGRTGESYNVGANAERSNLVVVRTLCALLDELRPDDPVVPHSRLITHVDERPGHDLRYAIDTRKLQAELGWAPRFAFETGLRATVQWYVEHLDWCAAVTEGAYDGRRLGLRRRGA